jgi:hypothetical protein
MSAPTQPLTSGARKRFGAGGCAGAGIPGSGDAEPADEPVEFLGGARAATRRSWAEPAGRCPAATCSFTSDHARRASKRLGDEADAGVAAAVRVVAAGEAPQAQTGRHAARTRARRAC